MKNHITVITGVLLAAGLFLVPCGAQETGHEGHSHGPGESHAEPESAAGALPPGGVAVPQGVRDNLGITFVKVERRVVQDTVRLPGRFEATPHAKAEYRAGARGLVTLLVNQYQPVAAGDVLYRIESSAWRELQGRLSQAVLAAQLIASQEDAARRAVEAATAGVEVWRSRSARLVELKKEGAAQASQLAEASSALASAEGALAEALAREQAIKIEALAVRDGAGGNPTFEIALREAATLLGSDPEWLVEKVDGQTRWKSLRSIEVRARRAGVVSGVELSDGALVEDGGLVLRTLDPRGVWFRGYALQADLGLLADGSTVRIVPPHGGIASYSESIEASLVIGTEADPEERTFDLVATPTTTELPVWARPGVAAFVEVVTSGSGDEELAIPLSSLAHDGLERIFFLRDRKDPDLVRRVVADVGADDGRWIVVNSGVRPGDEVVLSGVYELKLTGSGKEAQGGHFHSDGTFHAGKD